MSKTIPVQYSFPTLKNKEILSCMRELGIIMTLDQLQKPDSAYIRDLYEMLLFRLTNVNRELYRTPQFHALDQLNYPELHEESLVEVSMYQQLLKLFRSIGIHDISIRDLLEPDYSKTKKILSAIINFARFREDKLSAYTQLTETTELLMKEKNEAEELLVKEENELEKNSIQMNQENDKFLVNKSKISELQSAIVESHKVQQSTREQVKQQKSVLAELQEKLSADKFQLLNLKTEIEKLKLNVVKSPERLKKSLVELEQSLASEKHSKEELQTKYNVQQMKQKNLQNLIEHMEQSLVLAENLFEQQNKLTKLEQQNIAAENDCAYQQQQLQLLQSEESELNDQLTLCQQKFTTVQLKFEERKLQAKTSLEQVKAEKAALMRDLTVQQEQRMNQQKLVNEKKNQLQTLVAEHAAAMKMMKQKLQQLEQTVKQYQSRLLNTMAVVNQPEQNIPPTPAPARMIQARKMQQSTLKQTDESMQPFPVMNTASKMLHAI